MSRLHCRCNLLPIEGIESKEPNVTTVELRRRAKDAIDQLSGPRLRFVAELVENVRKRKLDRATTELLEIPGFLDSFARGIKDFQANRTRPWRKVRRDV